MLHLYDFHESGNGYKVRMLLARLGIPHRRTELDILRGETRTPAFLELNPNGRIPLVVFEDGRRLAESNAILFHLSRESPLWPDDPFEQAQALQWMFFEQYSHEPYLAVVRFWTFAGLLEAHAHELDDRRARGVAALEVMERHLRERPFFVGDRESIADIALYAYTHVAHEGGFDLSSFESIRAWLDRISGHSRHVAITDVLSSRD